MWGRIDPQNLAVDLVIDGVGNSKQMAECDPDSIQPDCVEKGTDPDGIRFSPTQLGSTGMTRTQTHAALPSHDKRGKRTIKYNIMK